MNIIKRGAEAILYLENEKLVKERIKKGYRIDKIDDELRKTRTKKEARLISEARRIGINVPNIFEINGNKIIMEFIDGKRLKDVLNESPSLAEEIGKSVGIMHSNGIVHGDLTTSNMILKDNKIYFIDFGLGDFSRRLEDLAIDMSVFREALKSTHFKFLDVLWESFIRGYKQTNPTAEKVLKVLDNVEKRGRYVKRGKQENGEN